MIVAIDTLKAHKRNYNKHPEHQVKRLTVSLRKFGQRKPITTWRNTVLTGHGVFLAAQQLGWKEIDVAPCPDKWTQEQALAWLAADNELARLADPDLAQLAEIIEEARNHDAELLEAIGFNEAEFAALLDKIAPDNPIDYAAAWQGMPEFEQEDAFGAIATVKVHFADETSIELFAKLVTQTVNRDTKFIWYPKQERLDLKKYRVSDES